MAINTLLTSLIADVYSVTGRPDLEAETKLAVKAATLKAHQSDYYFKDLLETGIQFATAEYLQDADLRVIIPNFRNIRYARRYDTSGTGKDAEFYTILTPGELLDSYGNDKSNVAYMAGTVLKIKSRVKLDHLLIGVYVSPAITDDTYSSWVATDHPYAVIFEAARLVFKQIGFDEQSTTFEKLAAEQFIELRMNNIQAVGY